LPKYKNRVWSVYYSATRGGKHLTSA